MTQMEKILADENEKSCPLDTFNTARYGFAKDSEEQIISFSALDDSCEIVIEPADITEVLIGPPRDPEALIGPPRDLVAGGDQILLLNRDLETPVQSPVRGGPTVTPARDETSTTTYILPDLASELTSQLNQLKAVDDQNIQTPYQCAQCDQLFASEEDFKIHLHQDHPSATGLNFQCQVCKNHFNSKTNLDEHQRTSHPDRSGFACDICGSKFTRSHSLKIHKRTHQGNKPYECAQCKKQFTDNSGLKEHVKIHSDEFAYKCTICLKSFKLRRTLRQHKQTHSTDRPYKCTVCDKGFTFKRNMIRHTEIHTQVGVYKVPPRQKPRLRA